MNLNELVKFDEKDEVEKIVSALRKLLSKKLKRRGLIIAISGGVDSGVCAALCVKALGKNKVFGLLLPEHDSSSSSSEIGERLAKQLGIEYTTHNIASTLEAIGCYKWRDDAMRETFPEYQKDWKNKLVISGGLEGKFNHFKLVVQPPGGETQEKRLALKQYLQIVAATNYKQRIRKTVEYFHADRLNYAVVGTPNMLEYDQGFFVKNGDGSADVKPIAHLYKTQVYALARYLGLPDEICTAIPSTDTYSLEQGQDEFYFALPYDKMDIALWAHNNDTPVAEFAEWIGITDEEASFVYKDIESKRSFAKYLHAKPYCISDAAS